jgi:hypothetical protein
MQQHSPVKLKPMVETPGQFASKLLEVRVSLSVDTGRGDFAAAGPC